MNEWPQYNEGSEKVEMRPSDAASIIFFSFLAAQGSQRWQEEHYRYFHATYPAWVVPKGDEIRIFRCLRQRAIPAFLGIPVCEEASEVDDAYTRGRALYQSVVPAVFDTNPAVRAQQIALVPSMNLHARSKHAGTREKRIDGESSIGLEEFEHALAREAHDFSRILNEEECSIDPETLLRNIAIDMIAKDHYYLCEHPGGRPRSIAQDLLPKTLDTADRWELYDEIPSSEPASFMQDRFGSHVIQLACGGLQIIFADGRTKLPDSYCDFYRNVSILLRKMNTEGIFPKDAKQQLSQVISVYNKHHSCLCPEIEVLLGNSNS